MTPGRGPFDGLGQVLRELRRDRELTQGELAQEAGLAQAEVRAFEEGERVPSLEVLGDLLGAMEAGAQELGHRLERARRTGIGGPEPPEELRRTIREMTLGLWAMIWFNWRRPWDGAGASEPSAELRARATEASETLAELLWSETAPEARGAAEARGQGAGRASA